MTKFEQMADCLNNFILSAGVDTVVSTSLISLYVTIRESMIKDDFGGPGSSITEGKYVVLPSYSSV